MARRRSILLELAVALSVVPFLASPAWAVEAPRGTWLTGSGAFDDGPHGSRLYHVEHRSFRAVLGQVRPLVALSLTDEGASCLAAGLCYDWPVARRLIFTPSLGVGWYRRGHDKDLGSPLEFRSAIQVACPLGRGWRLGYVYHHLSNWSRSDTNPGAESRFVSLSRSLGRR